MNRIAIASALAVVLSSGCSGSLPPPTFPTSHVPDITRSSTSARIQHVIIVVQDQRTFDNLFAGFPGANSATYGLTHDGKPVPLRETTFYTSAECFTPYGFGAFDTAWDHGKMDGFDRLDATKPLCPYTRISRSETKPYWDLAKRYALADNAFASTRYEAIRYVREGRDWKTDVVSPAARVLSDVKNGNLKQVSWVISGIRESDAPFVRSAGGPAWVNSIVQTAQKSRYWSHLAIIVVWASDGSEAFYDNVAPPQLSRMGLGLRVPMIVISPYAKRGYVSHTIYQNGGSTLRFIEESFGLKSLGATDVTANSIRDCFVQ